MTLVVTMAISILLTQTVIPLSTIAAMNDYEIDLKELRPVQETAKPRNTPPLPRATGEIDLKELRSVAPPQPAKPAQHVRQSHPAGTDSPKTFASEHESIHEVQRGEFLYQILIKIYGQSDQAAERLIPEVMRLNGITSPKGLNVGQRLRIPLQRTGKKDATIPAPAVASKTNRTTPTPIQAIAPVSPAKGAVHPPETTAISITTAPPCTVAREMVEKLGLMTPSPASIQETENVSAVYAGRTVTIICGLSGAERYTYERLLADGNTQLLVYEENESAERVVEKLAGELGLSYRKQIAGADVAHTTYTFSPFGVRLQDLQMTILPAQPPPLAPDNAT